MDGDEPPRDGWFEGVARGDTDAAAAAIRGGGAASPADWPGRAVAAGFAADEGDYYDALHDATMAATRAAVSEAERADDKQLMHAVRAMDDCDRVANELAERVAEWAGSLDPDAGTGVDYCRDLAERDPDPEERRVVELARRVRDLDDEAAALRASIERAAPEVAPNLSALAGPVLAARLIALAGGLKPLARKPSGTVQVLGAEEALFAHLRGHAPSPKHGVIYTHEAVRNTHPDDRGSAARALAGKLTIAARADHYTGERRAFDGRERLATRGPPVYGEPTDGEWRAWDTGRSKLGAMVERGLPTGLDGDETVLYLGAAAGTTVSHVADFAGPTYAVEFAPRPARDLLDAAEPRPNLFPLLKDAREPATYAHVVEPVDVLVQDVATRGQAEVALRNRRFLRPDGRLLLSVKARSEDVVDDPDAVFERVLSALREGYAVLERERLDPTHEDHLAVVAEPTDD